MKKNFYSSTIKKIKSINLKKISQRTKLIIVGVIILFALMFIYPGFSGDKSSRIMYWPGKVNQHFDITKKTWVTDADAYSGSDMDMLAYCQKFYPKTIKVTPYKEETIGSWHSVGNQGQYSATKMSYLCEQK